MRKISLLLFSFMFLSAGCGKGGSSDAVARVNKRPITRESLEKMMGRFARQPGKNYADIGARKDLLKEMIDEELLFQKGMKEGIAEKSDRLRREIAREYLAEKIGRERYEPTDDEVRKTYDTRQNELERVRASHILIKPDKPGDPVSEKKAEQKAYTVLAMLRKQGPKADFAKAAREYSQDMANKNQGGDLFFFTRDKMTPPFSEAAFALKNVGDLSGVVKTQFGYHIIKLTGEQRGFELLRQNIKWQITQEKQKERAEKLLADLRDSAKIRIYDDEVAKAQPPSVPPSSMFAPGGIPQEKK